MKNEIKGGICHIDAEQDIKRLKDKLKTVWNQYLAYNIFNLPEVDYQYVYEDMANSLGVVRSCHPVNDKATTFSKSRDIKPNPDLYHFYASSTRQPMHSDYAYYEASESPEWLMLYCLKASEYGGRTHILTVRTLKNIMAKYKPKLLEKIQIEVNWIYTGVDGDKEHRKPLLNGEFINWNYWQIKPELNSKEVMDVREEFHEFLEKTIVAGEMYDFSKSWQPGDCVIFNDKRVLHGRSAFLGDRWLKDQAIIS